jgi:tRNA pseudouridine55 synthase
MNGVLVVDKPRGLTSHDVVAVARRAIREKRIGHTGTLDPLATGVLPLVIGRATRLASLLSGTDKEYVADIRFGAATATFDAEGGVEAPDEPAGLDIVGLERVLPAFRGTYLQTPPAYSAKKSDGVRAYEKARRQQQPKLEPVAVTVSALVLESYRGGLARVRLRSSPGFYVRSFAHELGQRMGCGAYLEALRRTCAGGFSLERAVTLDVLTERPEEAVRHLVPTDKLLPDLPSVALNERGSRRAAHGNTLTFSDLARSYEPPDIAGLSGVPVGVPRIKLLDESGQLVAIGARLENGLLHPAIVLV